MFTSETQVAAIKAYLGSDHSYSNDEIMHAIDAEREAQARACKLPITMPDDLWSALCRRVARALAMKYKPLGYEPGVEGGLSYISANDSEIKRLEAPFRRRPIR